jgi:hypothetical protein
LNPEVVRHGIRHHESVTVRGPRAIKNPQQNPQEHSVLPSSPEGQLTSVVEHFAQFRVTLFLVMDRLDAHERLRRAAGILSVEGPNVGDTTLLFHAWDYLKGLRTDDLPADIRPAFSFLEHEIARAKSEELTPREVSFLSKKIRTLELMWIDQRADAPA